MSVTKKKIAVIDGNSWLHRAYHAINQDIKTHDGTPTNAVHGFLRMLDSFIKKSKPDAIVCAFDAGIPEFRLKAISQYKAQRKPMDNELRVQFPIIEEILKSLQIPVVKEKGWEGDDILGTIARLSTENNMDALLVTGDKDVNQLASENIKIVNMKKGVSDVAILGPDEVYKKYGVSVDQFIDYLALMGDSSDNIPGVPGVGPKTAQSLLEKYGSIEGIYENLDKLKGKQKENIENNKDSAYLSRQAATISCEVPITLDLDSVFFPSYTEDDIRDVFAKYGLRSAYKTALGYLGIEGELEKIGNSVKVGDKPKSAPKIKDINQNNLIKDENAFKLANRWLKDKKTISIATTNLLKAQVQSSIFDCADSEDTEWTEDNGNHDTLCVSVTDGDDIVILQRQNAYDFICSVAKSTIGCKCADDCHIIVEDSKEIFRLLIPADTDLDTAINVKDLLDVKFFDLGLAGYVLDSNKSTYNAIDLYSQLFGEILEDPAGEDFEKNVKKSDKKSQNYCEKKNKNSILRLAQRCCVGHAISDTLKTKIQDDGAQEVFWDIERPLTAVLVLMERNGCKIDTKYFSKLQTKFDEHINTLREQIINLAGEDFNVDSPKQLGHILFEVLGLPSKKKTKTGYSTSAEVLEDLSEIHPLPKMVIDYREYAKILSTYVKALPAMVGNDGRIHTTFHQRKTTTGRLSSSDPNIQNIPTRSELGSQIREGFIPLKKNHKMLCADYSQIELRLLAHLSADKGLIDAFNSGKDFHSSTAANIFRVDIDDVSRQQRSAAKAVNFGIIYGQQAYGLSQSLKIDMASAKDIIDRYFNTYKRVGEYLDELVKSATKLGYAQTMFGRRRYIPELSGNKVLAAFGKRTAMNHPMQGSAADIIKIAMRKVEESLLTSGIDAICMMQVHDELDFSVAENDIDKLSKIVKHEMENAAELSVPLVVDVSAGNNWAQAK